MPDFTELEQTFDVATEVVQATKKVGIQKPPVGRDKTDIRNDYEYTRGNLYSIIEKGQEAINGILELAEESQMPREYEVAGQLVKSVSDATDKLMDLQKKLKEVEEEKERSRSDSSNCPCCRYGYKSYYCYYQFSNRSWR